MLSARIRSIHDMGRTMAKILTYVVEATALNKPWLYLWLCSYVAMVLLVWMGNPLLPIASLANYGWAWHHIPEVLTFLFLGIWFGSWGFLSSSSFNYLDSIPLILLIITSVTHPFLYSSLFWLVLTIVSIPSFLGYFGMRWNRIHKTRSEASRFSGGHK